MLPRPLNHDPTFLYSLALYFALIFHRYNGQRYSIIGVVRRIILKPKSAVARHPLIICSPGWTLLKYPVVLLQRHLSNVLPTEVQDRIVRGKELRRLGLTIKGAGILATVASKEPIPHPSGQLRRDLIMVLHGEVADTAAGIHPFRRERPRRAGIQAAMTGAAE